MILMLTEFFVFEEMLMIKKLTTSISIELENRRLNSKQENTQKHYM